MLGEVFNENYNITEIVLAILIHSKNGAVAIHKNRPSHGFAFRLSGEGKFVFDDGKVFTLKKNDLIYLPKNSTYQAFSIETGDVYCINYQCNEEKKIPPFVLNMANAEGIINAYKKAEKYWRYKKEGAYFLCKSTLYEILFEIQKALSFPYLPESKINLLKPAIDYIHRKYTKELISVETLSEVCGISYEYCRQLFLRFFGCSPVKYINQLKLARAKELLSSGLYSVGEAAFLSGFSDVSHFSRFFKANVGVLPSEYKKG